MTLEQIESRIEAVTRKIEARRGHSGFAANVAACEAELANLEAQAAKARAEAEGPHG